MRVLFDTSVLVRLADTADPKHTTVVTALSRLPGRGLAPVLAPQVLIEFRAVATRPLGANGLGLTAAQADQDAAVYEATFPVLPETADIFPRWKAVVAALAVEGKTVHDARLAANCFAHGVTHLLTFNTRHFVRLAAFPPPLAVLHPAQV